MAVTTSGLEFHLLQAVPEGGGSEAIEAVVRSQLRGTDGVFIYSGDTFIAVEGGVPAASVVARRMMRALRGQGLAAKVRLVQEPFPASLGDVAYQFINEQVPLSTRPENRNPYDSDQGARL